MPEQIITLDISTRCTPPSIPAPLIGDPPFYLRVFCHLSCHTFSNCINNGNLRVYTRLVNTMNFPRTVKGKICHEDTSQAGY